MNKMEIKINENDSITLDMDMIKEEKENENNFGKPYDLEDTQELESVKENG